MAYAICAVTHHFLLQGCLHLLADLIRHLRIKAVFDSLLSIDFVLCCFFFSSFCSCCFFLHSRFDLSTGSPLYYARHSLRHAAVVKSNNIESVDALELNIKQYRQQS